MVIPLLTNVTLWLGGNLMRINEVVGLLSTFPLSTEIKIAQKKEGTEEYVTSNIDSYKFNIKDGELVLISEG